MSKAFNPEKFSEELKKKKADEDGSEGGGSWFGDGDNDPKFVKKDEPEEEQEAVAKKADKLKANAEVQGVINRLKNFIFPKNNRQRNLDRETGGLEVKEAKGIASKDVWDDRSEEVDKMGSTNTFNTSGMKSVVWKQKRARLAAKKHAEQGAEAGAAMAAKAKQGGYVERLRNLRLDRSSIDGRDGGGAGR